MRELFRDGGEKPNDADWCAGTNSRRLPSILILRLARTLRDCSADYTAKGQRAKADEMTECLFRLNERLTSISAPTMMHELVRTACDTLFLELVSSDQPPKYMKRTSEDWKKQIAETREDITKLTKANPTFKSALHPDTSRELLRRFNTEGERAAFKWLSTQREVLDK